MPLNKDDYYATICVRMSILVSIIHLKVHAIIDKMTYSYIQLCLAIHMYCVTDYRLVTAKGSHTAMAQSYVL